MRRVDDVSSAWGIGLADSVTVQDERCVLFVGSGGSDWSVNSNGVSGELGRWWRCTILLTRWSPKYRALAVGAA
jgi:hypothetical protein